MADLKLIKQLRELTGCGIADCNKALTACNNNVEESIDWLRKKGLSAAAKKSARTAAEGLIGIYSELNKASMVEVNSETDFVAKNEMFRNFVSDVVITAFNCDCKKIDDLLKTKYKDSSISIEEKQSNKIAVIGENINTRRVATLAVKKGIIATYMHNAIKPGLGKIGVLVGIKSEGDTDKLEEFGKKIAMHIAATKPEALQITDVDPVKIKRERTVFAEQAKNSGKPDNIIDKMIEGRLRKYYEEVVLMEQFFVMDDKKKISEVVKEFEKELGLPVSLESFEIFVLGEGVNKKECDFAEEVASMTK
ncbi:translation elongation factor Ts [Pseudomonadota bacterium]